MTCLAPRASRTRPSRCSSASRASATYTTISPWEYALHLCHFSYFYIRDSCIHWCIDAKLHPKTSYSELVDDLEIDRETFLVSKKLIHHAVHRTPPPSEASLPTCESGLGG